MFAMIAKNRKKIKLCIRIFAPLIIPYVILEDSQRNLIL
jgi:hypothetical protein